MAVATGAEVNDRKPRDQLVPARSTVIVAAMPRCLLEAIIDFMITIINAMLHKSLPRVLALYEARDCYDPSRPRVPSARMWGTQTPHIALVVTMKHMRAPALC